MIKNILYSLLLHSLFAAVVYANFHSHLDIKTIEINNGVKVSLASFDSKSSKPKEEIVKSEEIKQEIKKEIVKPKKIAKKEPKPKTIAKPKSIAEKNPEFKKPEPQIIEEKKIVESKNEEPEEKSQQDKNEDLSIKEVELAANNIDDLENVNLSAREKFNIQSQLMACYKRCLGDDSVKTVPIKVSVEVGQDGVIIFDLQKVIDTKIYNDPKETIYRRSIDAVAKTLELCSPLRNLPLEKYNVWHAFNIEFNNLAESTKKLD